MTDPAKNSVRLGRHRIKLPGSRVARIGLGVFLIIGGVLGFLPIVGFWMIPLGLLVLSTDIPVVRRWARRLTVWWKRRKGDGQQT